MKQLILAISVATLALVSAPAAQALEVDTPSVMEKIFFDSKSAVPCARRDALCCECASEFLYPLHQAAGTSSVEGTHVIDMLCPDATDGTLIIVEKNAAGEMARTKTMFRNGRATTTTFEVKRSGGGYIPAQRTKQQDDKELTSAQIVNDRICNGPENARGRFSKFLSNNREKLKGEGGSVSSSDMNYR